MRVRLTATAAAALVMLFGLTPQAVQLGGRPADEWIKTLESPARIQNLKIPETVSALKLKPGAVVADLGAGSGLFEGPLAEAVGPSGMVYAVDIDAGLIDAIARKATAGGWRNVKPVLGQFTDPGLATGSVDVAFINDVLHHVEQRAAYLGNVARILKPGGRIALIEYHPELGGHKNQPELQVSKSAAAALMAGIGFQSVEEIALFTDKYFTVYQKR